MKYFFIIIVGLTILGAYSAYQLIKNESKYNDKRCD
jgi:hypothetical protein